MKNIVLFPGFSLAFSIVILFNSCEAAHRSDNPNLPVNELPQDSETQIADYVVNIFEDSDERLWFGTMSKGVALYDGSQLRYLTTDDGLPSNTVVSMVEAEDGTFWIATHDGLSRYDGKNFTNYTVADGLPHNRISNLLIDKTGALWIGTWGGIGLYTNGVFSKFDLPVPDVEVHDYQSTMDWVTQIFEDRNGNIWIARDGYGVCKYDGNTFRHFSKTDGLASNNVQSIIEDKDGDLWFGSRIVEQDNPDPAQRTGQGGLNRYNGKTFESFPDVRGLRNSSIYTLYMDRSGDIWIGATGIGLYCYDGQTFQMYEGTDRMDLTYNFGVQSMLEDRNSNIWFGFSGGLFRLMDGKIINVTTAGPWD